MTATLEEASQAYQGAKYGGWGAKQRACVGVLQIGYSEVLFLDPFWKNRGIKDQRSDSPRSPTQDD